MYWVIVVQLAFTFFLNIDSVSSLLLDVHELQHVLSTLGVVLHEHHDKSENDHSNSIFFQYHIFFNVFILIRHNLYIKFNSEEAFKQEKKEEEMKILA